MSSEKPQFTVALSMPAEMAFPNLLEPKQFEKNGRKIGDPKFGASFVFPKDHPDYAAIKTAMLGAAKAKLPGVDPKSLALPVKSGEREIEAAKASSQRKGKTYSGGSDFMAGKLVLKASSKFRPGLSYIDGNRIVDLTDESAIKANIGKFFFGAEVLVQLNFVGYEGDDRNPSGVTCYLNHVLATGKGTKRGGEAKKGSEVFKGYMGQASAEDPTTADDDLDL